ncbi:MAG: hypothetical protein GTO03_06835 [Planctomycetales bacterium]|nr:hypothetical protein [Planctomycetales bacterium]
MLKVLVASGVIAWLGAWAVTASAGDGHRGGGYGHRHKHAYHVSGYYGHRGGYGGHGHGGYGRRPYCGGAYWPYAYPYRQSYPYRHGHHRHWYRYPRSYISFGLGF